MQNDPPAPALAWQVITWAARASTPHWSLVGTWAGPTLAQGVAQCLISPPGADTHFSGASQSASPEQRRMCLTPQRQPPPQ